MERGYNWYVSKQLNEGTKEFVISKLKSMNNKIDIILSHTCPYKYLPIEMFLEGIAQLAIDNSTEYFPDKIEQTTKYKTWYCGHYHTDKTVDKIIFMFHKIEKFT